MLYKTKNSRTAIPGYSLVPRGEYHQVYKIGLTAKQVRTLPAFSKTRKMAEEFAAVAKLGKLLRDAFNIGETIKQHPKIINSVLKNILHTDQVYPPGSRIFSHATFDSLLNFHFNKAMPVQQVLKPGAMPWLQTAPQQITATVPAFIPYNEVKKIAGCSHFRIQLTLASVDLQQLTGRIQTKRTTLIPWKPIRIPKMEMVFDEHKEHADLYLLAVTVNGYTPNERSGKLGKSIAPGACTIIGVYGPGIVG